jgi:hypothetical protein
MTFDSTNERIDQWIKFEHSRLHHVQEWPESAHKETVLTAIHSVLARLEVALAPQEPPRCSVCASGKAKPKLLEFPSRSRGLSLVTRPAA